MDVLPHKALNGLDTMHYYLKQRVMKSSHVTDLIPFINTLFNIEKLKHQILTALDTQYQHEISKEISSLTATDSKSKHTIIELEKVQRWTMTSSISTQF